MVRFVLPSGRNVADATAIISREPEEVFGRSNFGFPVWKIKKATAEQVKFHQDRAKADSPGKATVMFTDAQPQGPSVRARAVAPREAIQMIAGTPMKQAVVKVLAKGTGR